MYKLLEYATSLFLGALSIAYSLTAVFVWFAFLSSYVFNILLCVLLLDIQQAKQSTWEFFYVLKQITKREK